MVFKYFTVLLVNKTKLSNPCYALKNSVAVKGLKVIPRVNNREGECLKLNRLCKMSA